MADSPVPLTPEREAELRQYAEVRIDDAGRACRDLLAALDAEAARADTAERERAEQARLAKSWAACDNLVLTPETLMALKATALWISSRYPYMSVRGDVLLALLDRVGQAEQREAGEDSLQS